jgi:hypothetical protein
MSNLFEKLVEINVEEGSCIKKMHESERCLKALIKEGRYSDAKKEIALHDDIFRHYIALGNEWHKLYYGTEKEWPTDLWYIPPEYRIPEGPDRVKQPELFGGAG